MDDANRQSEPARTLLEALQGGGFLMTPPCARLGASPSDRAWAAANAPELLTLRKATKWTLTDILSVPDKGEVTSSTLVSPTGERPGHSAGALLVLHPGGSASGRSE